MFSWTFRTHTHTHTRFFPFILISLDFSVNRWLLEIFIRWHKITTTLLSCHCFEKRKSLSSEISTVIRNILLPKIEEKNFNKVFQIRAENKRRSHVFLFYKFHSPCFDSYKWWLANWRLPCFFFFSFSRFVFYFFVVLQAIHNRLYFPGEWVNKNGTHESTL